MPLPWSSENPCGNEDGVARAGNPRQAWTRPSPTAPMRWRVLRSTNTGCNHAGSLQGFKATYRYAEGYNNLAQAPESGQEP